jgi:hypothetical protein
VFNTFFGVLNNFAQKHPASAIFGAFKSAPGAFFITLKEFASENATRKNAWGVLGCFFVGRLLGGVKTPYLSAWAAPP